MRKTIKSKVVLNRETIRMLRLPALEAAAGAKNITAKDTLDECPTAACTTNCTVLTLCT